MDSVVNDAASLLVEIHRKVQMEGVSLRLNTFTKMELEKWLNEPFTPPPEQA